MSKRKKLLQKLRNNPKNVTFEQLITLLNYYGIIVERIRGSHHVLNAHIEDKTYTLAIPYQKPLKATYVYQALELIAKVEASWQEEENEDDE
jgi:hypothetical protein